MLLSYSIALYPHMFLGVDGGGTKVSMCLFSSEKDDEPTTLFVTGPCTNHNSVGWPAAEKAFAETFQKFPISHGSPLVGACLGMSGAGLEADRQKWLEIAHKYCGEGIKVKITTDAEIALSAGGCYEVGSAGGMVCIAGTGTICVSSKNGQRCQGWGPLLGDEGSGYSVGMAALQSVMRWHDGRTDNDEEGVVVATRELSEAVLQHCRVESPTDLVLWAYRQPLPHDVVASLASVVATWALRGDVAAMRIVKNAARQLLRSIKTLLPRSGLQYHPSVAAPWTLVLTGGLIQDPTSPVGVELCALVGAEEWGKCVRVVRPSMSSAEAAARFAKIVA